MLLTFGLFLLVLWLLAMLGLYSVGWPIHILILVVIIIIFGETKKRKRLPGGTEKFMG